MKFFSVQKNKPQTNLTLRTEINTLHYCIQAQDGNEGLANFEAQVLTGSSDSALLFFCPAPIPAVLVLKSPLHFSLLVVEDGASLFSIISFWLKFE